MILSIEFQEAYKKLDKLCKDCFSSTEGVSEYIRLMETESLCGARYIQFWESDYKELKHVRWVRNQLSHEVGTLQSDICTQSDLEYVEDFYERIMNGNDPLTKLRQAKSIVKTQQRKPVQIQKELQKQSEIISGKTNELPAVEIKTDKKSFFRRIWEKIKSIFS